MKQLPLDIGIDSEPTFERFVVGANAAAVTLLRQLAPPAAPVYLWGGAGTGKSHLLRAALRQCCDAGGHAARFDAQCPVPWTLERPTSLLVIDDCERLDAAQQHAAFSLFVETAPAGTPIVAAGRLPPVDLPLREDLRTRLGWGLVFALQPLGEAEARAVLRSEAQRRGLVIGDELLSYLLSHFERDLKHLVQQLDQLDAYALQQKRAPTLPLLRQMLAQPASEPG